MPRPARFVEARPGCLPFSTGTAEASLCVVNAGATRQLLEALIGHLEGLREEGVRWVEASPGVLSEATGPISAARAARPAPGVQAGPGATLGGGTRPAEPGRAVPAPAGGIVLPARPVLDGAALGHAEKLAAMESLRRRAMACEQCAAIARARRSVVFGVGDVGAALMLVGEAPGREEDEQGEPFVGAAGQLLTKILVAMGLGREKVYIANVLKCRPDTPGEAYGNRKPSPEEMATCLPYLFEQVKIVRPRVIVTLGGTALEGLLGQQRLSVTRMRGRWTDFAGVPVMPTYHPSYVLRQDTLSTKREVWEDMLAVMERLGMPISAKQRGYFMKA